MIELSGAIEAILFAAGDCVPAARLSLILGADVEEIFSVAGQLGEKYQAEGRGMRILRLGDKLQMCSAPEYAPLIAKTLETRRPPMLSPPALETLAIVAYFQPVTRAYIEQMRGVDSSYTVSVLTERGLIEPCGRLDVPGRPTIFRTTDAFLRTMGITELSQLPPLPDVSGGEGVEKLQSAIEKLKSGENGEQLSLNEITGAANEE